MLYTQYYYNIFYIIIIIITLYLFLNENNGCLPLEIAHTVLTQSSLMVIQLQ